LGESKAAKLIYEGDFFMNKLLLLLFTPAISLAAVQKLAPTGGQVEFLAQTSPSFIKIHGTGKPATGQLSVNGDKVEGKFEFELTTLDTEMGRRNEHMKKYLEVEKYPKASLELKSVKPLVGWTTKSPKLEKAAFEGVMTLHGQNQPVKGQLSINEKGAAEVTFRVNLDDYKIEQPSFAGVTVQKDIDVTVKIDQLKEI